MFSVLITHIVLGLSIAAPLGPMNIEIVKRGIEQGFWHSWIVGWGGMSSDFLLMFLMYFGLSQFLLSASVHFLMLVCGFFVLVYMGAKNLKQETIKLDLSEQSTRKKGVMFQSYLSGVIIAGFNPLNLLFWIGIYGSVLSHSLLQKNHSVAFLHSTAIFIGIGLWNLNLAMTVHFGRNLFRNRILKGITIAASLVLIGYGLHLGYQAVIKVMEWLS